MPNQNDPADPNQTSVPQGTRPVLTTEEVPTQQQPQPSNSDIVDVPPPPPPPPGPTATDTAVSPFTANPNQGEQSPNFDLRPVVGAPPRKKFGGKKVISTILGLILLVGGVGVGVSLVRQQQNLGEAAKAPSEKELCTGCATNGQKWVWVNGECKKRAAEECKEKQTDNPNLTTCSGFGAGGCKGKKPGGACGDGTCVMTNTETRACECQGGRTQTDPPATAAPKAQCTPVKAYDENDQPLSQDQLKALKTGDKVRFAVGGSATGTAATFDKAKFKINSTDSGEVTTKNANGEFFFEFTIPDGTTSFNIKGQIHHTTVGWSPE